MKPFQFYTVRRFPKLGQGNSVSTHFQMTFSGEGEDVHTTVTLEKPDFEGPLDLLRVKSQIKHQTFGFIKTVIDSQRRRFEFNEYLEPVDFEAYYAARKRILIFQAPKRACRGVLGNLRRSDCGIELADMVVDFAKVLELVSEYQAAWFRGVSSRVRAAGIHGEQIQDDTLFKKLLKDGELSNVTIPWRLDEVDHRVMITATGAIVLIQDYKTNIGLELQVAMDVYDKLLSKVWEERKSKRRAADSPADP